MPPTPPHTSSRPKRPRGAKPTPKERKERAPKYQPKKKAVSNLLYLPSQLSYWLNDVDGDCVTAEEAFAKAVAAIMQGSPELFIQDATVQAWASQYGFLSGADLASVLDQMAIAGFVQDGNIYGDGPASTVDWTNAATLQAAIAEGPVKLGIVGDPLDAVVGTTNGWLLTGVPKQDPANEDHCVSLCGYGTVAQLASGLGVPLPQGIQPSTQAWALFTWDTVGIVDTPSLLAITFEAWVRFPTTVFQEAPPPPPPPPPVTGLQITFPDGLAGGTYQLLPVAAGPVTVTISPIAAALLQALLSEMQRQYPPKH